MSHHQETPPPPPFLKQVLSLEIAIKLETIIERIETYLNKNQYAFCRRTNNHEWDIALLTTYDTIASARISIYSKPTTASYVIDVLKMNSDYGYHEVKTLFHELKNAITATITAAIDMPQSTHFFSLKPFNDMVSFNDDTLITLFTHIEKSDFIETTITILHDISKNATITILFTPTIFNMVLTVIQTILRDRYCVNTKYKAIKTLGNMTNHNVSLMLPYSKIIPENMFIPPANYKEIYLHRECNRILEKCANNGPNNT